MFKPYRVESSEGSRVKRLGLVADFDVEIQSYPDPFTHKVQGVIIEIAEDRILIQLGIFNYWIPKQNIYKADADKELYAINNLFGRQPRWKTSS